MNNESYTYYAGYTIDYIGTNAYISGGTSSGFGMMVPKHEGKSLEQCTKDFIDEMRRNARS